MLFFFFFISLECLWYVFKQYLLTKAMVFKKGLRCFFLKNKLINYKINKMNNEQ